jgi:NADH:ubiquinone oxidoreductase subunit 5 (subunit L)/multisubunit Na+/H+ antiporter MnhA subunit
MSVFVLLISGIIQLYTFSYLSKDENSTRFSCYLSIFTVFMLLLVLSSNLISLFIGWEGVGISSYLLINFWDKRIYANQAAIKAIVLNKIGDIGFLFVIASLYYLFQIINIADLQILWQLLNTIIMNNY